MQRGADVPGSYGWRGEGSIAEKPQQLGGLLGVDNSLRCGLAQHAFYSVHLSVVDVESGANDILFHYFLFEEMQGMCN